MLQAVVEEINNLKNGDRYNDFCVNDALSHLKNAQECLEARETNPKQHFQDGVKHAKWVMKVTPIMSVITDYIDGTGSW